MRDLEAMHEAVERAIQSIERYRKSPASGTISLEFIDQRHILYIPCQENFYDGGVVAYERAVGELRRELMRRNVPQLLSYSLGTSVKREDFQRQILTADKIFIFGDKHLRDYGENFQVIESGMFACLYLDDFDQEAEGARKLLAYCQANRYTPSGDYLCEEMTELNLFDHRKRQHVHPAPGPCDVFKKFVKFLTKIILTLTLLHELYALPRKRNRKGSPHTERSIFLWRRSRSCSMAAAR